jgi:hypothetical protein
MAEVATAKSNWQRSFELVSWDFNVQQANALCNPLSYNSLRFTKLPSHAARTAGTLFAYIRSSWLRFCRAVEAARCYFEPYRNAIKQIQNLTHKQLIRFERGF